MFRFRPYQWRKIPFLTRGLFPSILLLLGVSLAVLVMLFPTQNTKNATQNQINHNLSITLDNSIYNEVNQDNINSNISKKNRLNYFAELDTLNYIKSLFRPYLSYSGASYLIALLILLIYLFYLRYIDIYEYEPWSYIILTFIAGVFFSEVGIVLYDFTTVVLGWTMNDGLINDFFYTIIVIGGIEEVVKILPLLLLLRFTKIINEPVDYIVYAGVAALGFAFAENIMYFNYRGIEIAVGRALTAVIIHTSLSGIVAYGFVLSQYRNKKWAPLRFLLLAMVLHGLYDLFLLNPHVSFLKILSYLILFACISTYNHILANTLSNSPYYSKSVHLEIRKIQFLLLAGILGLVSFQFVLLALTESYEVAKDNTMSSIFYCIIFAPALLIGFGKIQLHPKKWKSLKLPLLITKIVIDKEEVDLVGNRFILSPITKNHITNDYLPNMGEVYKQTKDSHKRRWFYIRLDRMAHHPKYNNKHIVIRSKIGNELFNQINSKGISRVYLISNKTKKLKFIGLCSLDKEAVE